jgi:hypothetical protein
VYEYNISETKWVQVGQTLTGTTTSDRCGAAVDLTPEGTRIAVGFPYYNSQRGLVRIYDYNDTTWVRKT